MKNLSRRSGLQRMSREMRGLSRAMAPLGRAARSAAGGMARLAGLSGAVSLGAAAASIKGFADEADRLAKLGRMTGFAVQQLRDLEHVGGLVGISQQKIAAATGTFNKRLGELRAGTGMLASVLKKTNPELLKQLKTAETTPEALEAVISAMRALPNEADRAALAAAAFSKANQEMSQFATLSADELSKLVAEGRNLRGVLSDDAANKAEAFNDSLYRVGQAVKGIRDAIGTDLMPKLTPLVEKLAEFAVLNREAMSSNIADAITAIATNLSNVDWQAVGSSLVSLGKSLFKFGETVSTIAGYFGGLEGAMIAVGAITFAPLIASVGQVAVAASRVALAFGPIGWAVAAVTFSLTQNWEAFSDSIARITTGIKETVMAGFGGIAAVISGDFATAAKEGARYLGGIKEAFGGIGDTSKAFIDGLIIGINNLTGTKLPTLKSSLEGLGKNLEGAFDGVQEAWSTALDGIKDYLAGWKEWILKLLQPVIDTANKVRNAFSGFSGLMNGNSAHGEQMTGAERRKARGRATGGPVRAGGLYKVGEHGEELFVPGSSGGILSHSLLKEMVRGRQSQAQPPQIEGGLDINVKFANAPAGTSAHTQRASSIFRKVYLDTGAVMA